jgi:DNA-binding MarR family transcriptional regulator
MCYTYIIMVTGSRFDRLDELLVRIYRARQSRGWRRRIVGVAGGVPTLSTLRVLRAVEQCEQAGRGASVRDVADYMAVEHSTASRTVAGVVATGLLTKTYATDDQRRCVLVLTDDGRNALAEVSARRRQAVAETVAGWPTDDVDTLVALLDRLAAGFDRVSAS